MLISSWSKHISLYVHETVLEASLYDSLTAEIEIQLPVSWDLKMLWCPQDPNMCTTMFSVVCAQLPSLLPSLCCTSEMYQCLSFIVLVPNVGAFSDHVYRVRSGWQRLWRLSTDMCLYVCFQHWWTIHLADLCSKWFVAFLFPAAQIAHFWKCYYK